MIAIRDRKQLLAKGALDMLPLSLAVLPWGILCGSLAIQKGFSFFEAQLMSLVVFAGSAQLVSIELIHTQVPLPVILVTTLIISARHLLYGLAVRSGIVTHPLKWRLGLGFLLTDELFALANQPSDYTTREKRFYALAAGGSFYLLWNLWTLVGILAGTVLPDLTGYGLDFAIAATFIALVIPTIRTWSVLASVLVAAVGAIIFAILEMTLGLLLAAGLAMAVGYHVSRWEDRA